ncbi:hypothetical protein GND96_08405 [Citrobacter sp. JL976]|uniref:hypothetical protein n=1 Tax=Citrobacter TaxID=544 RepID=UPI000CDEADFA|nr:MULTISPECIES: hypothetical protein [Citrobacter]MTW55427.1 hypothetical protein [Citrobacter sp. JL976]POZ48869.1 hypothetical protein CF017_04300 [Citrobacter braakii]TCC74947.1 hypothetical protein EY917_05880 [Citrobacter braakii]
MATLPDHRQNKEPEVPHTFVKSVLAETNAIFGSSANRKLTKDMVIEAIKAVPLVGGAVSATEKFIHGIAEIERETRLDRLENYLRGLNCNYDEDVEFRQEDMLSIIKKLAVDDEDAKTEYYTRLTLKLGRMALSDMPSDIRLHFIRTVSTLTRYQIEFARELKIRKSVPICGTVSLEEAEMLHTGQASGMAMKAVRALQNEGLLKETARPPRAGPPAEPLYDLTHDFNTLMGLLFHPSDFKPETIGLKCKNVSDIILVGQRQFINNLYVTYLPVALRKAGINAKMVNSDDNHLSTEWAPLYLHTNILDDNGKKFIKLHLTREGKPPIANQTVNYINCRFEERIYGQHKSNSQREVDFFLKEMDRVVSCVMGQMKEMSYPV